jgi:hypothetical protein
VGDARAVPSLAADGQSRGIPGRPATAVRRVPRSLAQTIYTPRDGERRRPDPDDRPYAGVLSVALGFNVRDGDTLRTNELVLGVVGPASGTCL